MRALGGWGKHIQICLRLAQNRFLELPQTRPKPQSEHEASTEQAARANASVPMRGDCEV